MISTRPGVSGRRPAVEIDELRRIEPERAEVDAIFVDGGPVPLHLLDERDERTAEGHDVGEVAPAEHAGAHLEEIFGGGVGVVDAQPLADNKQRMGQRTEQDFGQNRRWLAR